MCIFMATPRILIMCFASIGRNSTYQISKLLIVIFHSYRFGREKYTQVSGVTIFCAWYPVLNDRAKYMRHTAQQDSQIAFHVSKSEQQSPGD